MKSHVYLQNGAQQHKFIIKTAIKNGNSSYCSVAFVIPFYVINCAVQRTCEPQRVAVGRPCRYRFTKQLWPNRGRHSAFLLLGLGGKECSRVQGADVDEVGLPALPQAERGYLFV